MKKYSFIILFSFFFLINNVHAEYYLTPNTFTMSKTNSQLQFDYYGVNNGNMSNVYTLDGYNDTWFRFQFELDGSNCATNIDSAECFNTIHAIEEGSTSNTIYGSFQMCVSKPQFHWEVNWDNCSDNCLKKSQDLVIINNSYQNCTLGLYDTETGTNMTNEGYLVNVYFDIAKWQYIEGAYSGLVNGRIYLYNDSESILYYRFVNNVLLSDRNMSSFDSGYGIFNHDYNQPDIGGETFLMNGTCVMSYNRMNNYNISTWDRETETLTFNNTLPFSKFFGEKNKFDIRNVKSITQTDYTLTNNNDGSITIDTIRNSTIRPAGTPNKLSDYCPDCQVGKTYTLSFKTTGTINYIYLLNSGVQWFNGTSRQLTQNDLNSIVYWGASGNGTSALISNIQIELGSSKTEYNPYGGYLISYDNIGGDFDIFRWYDTNLNSNGILYYRLTSYTGRTKVGDLVNCPNSRVCRFENELYFSGSFTSLFNSEEQRIKKIEFMLVSSTMSVYFKNPYIYNLEDVPGNATWDSYYQPANVYICSDNDNGTYYNAMNKKVYYNPDKPPSSFVSNVNSEYQNIFGQSVNFYGLTEILNFPIQIITKINNGEYRNCSPLEIPFPGFPNKTLTLPCFSTFLWDRYPTMREMYNVIVIGYISLQVAKGTINYIKKWYLGTVESEDL